jgi:hypothetical protein
VPLYSSEVLSSNFRPEIGYPDRLSWNSSVPSGKHQEGCKSGNSRSLTSCLGVSGFRFSNCLYVTPEKALIHLLDEDGNFTQSLNSEDIFL